MDKEAGARTIGVMPETRHLFAAALLAAAPLAAQSVVGAGCVAPVHAANLLFVGAPQIGTTWTAVPVSSGAYPLDAVVLGNAAAQIPLAGLACTPACVLHPSPDVVTLGPAVLPIPGDASLIGVTFYAQGLHGTSGGIGPCSAAFDLGLSDAYEVTITP